MEVFLENSRVDGEQYPEVGLELSKTEDSLFDDQLISCPRLFFTVPLPLNGSSFSLGTRPFLHKFVSNFKHDQL